MVNGPGRRHPATVFRYEAVEYRAIRFEHAKGAFPAHAHQPTVADHIGSENCGEPAFDTPAVPWEPPSNRNPLWMTV